MSNLKRKKTDPASAFDRALAFVLEHEGGYVNDPADPGGETHLGISRRAYPEEDIKGMTRARAAEIYQADYWRPARCDALAEPLALALFDSAVNMGVSAAAQLLQRAIGAEVDGLIGPHTLAKAQKADPQKAATDLLAFRLARYARLDTSPTYMRGWSRRVLALPARIARMDAGAGTKAGAAA